ncbi:DUF6503 family protein [Croceitalea rosinachiae]|uniref:DUF6503 family protein n=1 Tax=Croceitalea rosinachiae TaxID=3075596 RepID=A0ABU3AE81_9FLAO|nr:DUF6503 family protein [Croceitalea sp. F388]MDT0608105.1 DUF6503 family protein [Croceitalea sp. F388]
MKLTLKILSVLALSLFISCAEKTKKEVKKTGAVVEEVEKAPIYDTNDPQTVLAAIEYAHGGWNDLWKKGDVQYTYNYHSTDANKTDISTERYIFSNEASYGHYTKHEINVMPDVEGNVTQCFDGEKTVVLINGEKTDNPQGNVVGDFLRKANYFWFVMPYKLNDQGTITTYIGQEELNGKTYDKLNVTYDPKLTGKEENDIYILYVNPETKLIDRFFFSLPFMGVNEPVIIADYEYSDVEGQMIATKRNYYMPSPNGYADSPNLVQTLTDIKFNSGFTTDNLMAASK